MKKQFTCIVCPEGCLLAIDEKQDGSYTIKGNKCKRGKKFAVEEIINPKRVVTTTIKINGRNFKRLPVRSDKPVPKEDMIKLVEEIKKLKVKKPVAMGDVLLRNFNNSNINVIASMDITE